MPQKRVTLWFRHAKTGEVRSRYYIPVTQARKHWDSEKEGDIAATEFLIEDNERERAELIEEMAREGFQVFTPS